MLKDVSLSIEPSETIVLLGPSGCGKTTLLRLINRLEEPNQGSIYIDGEAILEKPKEFIRRGIGYVIQNAGLLPHLTVQRNIELAGVISNQQISNERLIELLELIGLDQEVLHQKPSELSGGQQQRIGIARALATDPDIILMDEPFSALDNITRGQLQSDFANLDQLEEKTIILVTHDVQEAFRLGDRIVLLDDGEIQQVGTPFELLREPVGKKVVDFLKKDRFMLSLQTSQLSGKSLFDILSSPETGNKEKEDAFQLFLNQGKW